MKSQTYLHKDDIILLQKVKKKSSKHPDSDSLPVRKYQVDSVASPLRKSRIQSDTDVSSLRKS
jgi:hypothetical protein